MTQAEKESRIANNLAFIKDQTEAIKNNPPSYPHEYVMKAFSIVIAARDCELIASTPSDEKLKEWGALPARLNTAETLTPCS